MVSKKEDFNRLDTCYALAIEHGDYRRALRFALRAYRKMRWSREWRVRVQGCWTRRSR